jgi:hypothetical protein
VAAGDRGPPERPPGHFRKTQPTRRKLAVSKY